MDIDIDISSKVKPEQLFDKIRLASMISHDNKLVKHNVGTYFQNIPIDPVTNLSAIPYKEAQDFGYFKIDMLHLNVLDMFQSKDQMNELLEKTPKWDLLLERDNVAKLFQLSNQFETVYATKPKSILELADTVALIRPNKQKLLDKYLKNKKEVRKELYMHRNPEDLRKSHAIPYAMIIVLQLHLIEQGLL